MKRPVLLDTGPLVAYVNRREQRHAWAQDQFQSIPPPQFTCEAVLTEAAYLLRNLPGAPQAILNLVARGVVAVPFQLASQARTLAALMTRYRNIPMSLADACLVRMAEVHDQATVFTLDHDFHIYRKHGRQVIPTLMPDDL